MYREYLLCKVHHCMCVLLVERLPPIETLKLTIVFLTDVGGFPSVNDVIANQSHICRDDHYRVLIATGCVVRSLKGVTTRGCTVICCKCFAVMYYSCVIPSCCSNSCHCCVQVLSVGTHPSSNSVSSKLTSCTSWVAIFISRRMKWSALGTADIHPQKCF